MKRNFFKKAKMSKRSTANDIPTGILRLAAATQYCLSYPKVEFKIHVNVLLCYTDDNIKTDDEYSSTIERGQNFQFLDSEIILITGSDYCLHAWDKSSIAGNLCNQGLVDTGFDVDTWMITDDPTNKQLNYFQIINLETNLCLSASPSVTGTNDVSLSKCNGHIDQFFIFERITSNQNFLESKKNKNYYYSQW